jgi:hypothetical protein
MRATLHALGSKRIQHLRRKVQALPLEQPPSPALRENGLVALAIRARIVAADIGRQRHVANPLQHAKEIVDRLEAQQPLAKLPSLQHLGFEHDLAFCRRKDKPLADSDFSPWPHQRAPENFARRRFRFVVSHPFRRKKRKGWCTGHLWDHRLGQHHFDAPRRLLALAPQGPPCIKPRRNHAAVVQHQQIARLQQRSKIAEASIPQRAGSRDPRPASGSWPRSAGGSCAINSSAGRSRSRKPASRSWPRLH